MIRYGLINDWVKDREFTLFLINITEQEGFLIMMVGLFGLTFWLAISPWNEDFYDFKE